MVLSVCNSYEHDVCHGVGVHYAHRKPSLLINAARPKNFRPLDRRRRPYFDLISPSFLFRSNRAFFTTSATPSFLTQNYLLLILCKAPLQQRWRYSIKVTQIESAQAVNLVECRFLLPEDLQSIELRHV